MTTQLDEDNYLTIQLLSYNRPTGLTERFYFLEMSTLQATTLLTQDKKIASTKVVAHNDDNNYLDDQTTASFKTIVDFNDFFINNPYFYIHICDIELEDGINLSSHDDGEVSIQFLSDNSDQTIIDNIFEKYNLDKKLISILKNKPGHYVDGNSSLVTNAILDIFYDEAKSGAFSSKDFLGDIDIWGLKSAWERLIAVKGENNFKLSDVIEHYYGPYNLRNQHLSTFPSHVSKRFTIFCAANGLLDSNNNFVFSQSKKEVWYIRLSNFAVFFYTAKSSLMKSRLIAGTLLRQEKKFDTSDWFRTFSSDHKYYLLNKFKNKIQQGYELEII